MTAVLPPRATEAADQLLPCGRARSTAARPPVRAFLRIAGRWSLRALVATAVLAFLGLAVGPHVLDYRTMTMLTGSMAPAIEPGDVVISTPLDVEDVTEGMVISYHIPIDDHRLVTHRVIDVQHAADGTVTVQTQGDANQSPDPWTAVLTGDTAYQMQAVVPEIGHVVTVLRNSTLSILFVELFPVAIGVWMLVGIWRPTRHLDDEDGPASTHWGVTP